MNKVKYLVVDSGAFIKNAPVHEYAENIYTVDGAIKEIKDKATRQRLQFLPYTLQVKEPCPNAYKYVLDFSKKTGDFSTLSIVDLQIIALTYQLEKENVGTDHLNTEPVCKVTSKPCFADIQLSGFYQPEQRNSNSVQDSSDDSLSVNINVTKDSHNEDLENNKSEGSDTCIIENCDRENYENKNEIHEDSDDVDSESDGEEGWITSSNITEMQKKMGAMTLDEEYSVCVACITTDFSVQNVLLQIGLHILSVDGMLIKNTRVFILRCYSCYKTTSDISKTFCPNCGNKTLKRVAVTYSKEGSMSIHINFKKPLNIRGTKYSLPMPKGGKHSVNPVLCADQRIPHNRPSKMALQRVDALSPNYEALHSPFAVNDICSRAANIGIRSNKSRNQKKNPNEWSTRTGNRKGKK